MYPHLKPFSRVCTTVPYPSSAKACAIAMGPDTSPHVPRFTGFDHRHQCRCLECASSPKPPRQPDSTLQAAALSKRDGGPFCRSDQNDLIRIDAQIIVDHSVKVGASDTPSQAPLPLTSRSPRTQCWVQSHSPTVSCAYRAAGWRHGQPLPTCSPSTASSARAAAPAYRRAGALEVSPRKGPPPLKGPPRFGPTPYNRGTACVDQTPA